MPDGEHGWDCNLSWYDIKNTEMRGWMLCECDILIGPDMHCEGCTTQYNDLKTCSGLFTEIQIHDYCLAN